MKKNLLIITSLLFSLFVSAQNQKISFESTGPVALSEVFRQIERQTGMTVAYNEKTIDVSRPVQTGSKVTALNEVLKSVLEGTGATFRIQGNIIAIVIEDNEHTYTGVVKDALGPVSGAVIMSVGGAKIPE